MHWILLLSAVAGFLLYKLYGPKVRGLLGVNKDDLDETFFGKTVAIQGPSDNYKRFCGVKSKDSPVVDCQSLQVTDNHLFDVEKTGDCRQRPDGKTECQFALKNKLTGQYCADENDKNRFICNRPAPGAWEKHAFIKQPGLRVFSFPGGQSGKNRKSCNDKGSKGIVCDGNFSGYPDTYERNALFRWLQSSEVLPGQDGTAKVIDDPYASLFGKYVAITGPASDHTTYCGVKSLADPVVTCEDTTVYDNHLFEIGKTQDCNPRLEGGQECQFSLKNKLTGAYCSDEGDRIICDRPSVNDWEKFALIKTPGLREFSFPGAKSGKRRNACSDKVSGIVCQGAPNTYGRNETFRWKLAAEIPDAKPGDMRAPVTQPTSSMSAASETSNAQNVQPSSATMPSPSSSSPTSVDDLNTTFFNQTVVITGPASDHTRYCGVKSASDPTIECEDTEVFDNHQFEVRKTGECNPRIGGGVECQFAFKNKLTGKFCSDEGNRIVCDRDEIKDWEKYAFIKHPEGRDFSFPGAKSGEKRQACTDKANNIVCDGGKDDYRRQNTRFRWKLLSEMPSVNKGDNGPVEITTEEDTPPDEEPTDPQADDETSADMNMGSLMAGGTSPTTILTIVAVFAVIGLVMRTPRASV